MGAQPFFRSRYSIFFRLLRDFFVLSQSNPVTLRPRDTMTMKLRLADDELVQYNMYWSERLPNFDQPPKTKAFSALISMPFKDWKKYDIKSELEEEVKEYIQDVAKCEVICSTINETKHKRRKAFCVVLRMPADYWNRIDVEDELVETIKAYLKFSHESRIVYSELNTLDRKRKQFLRD